jgi:hypothetical protein
MISASELGFQEIERVHVLEIPKPTSVFEESAIHFALSQEERMVLILLQDIWDLVKEASRRIQANALRNLAESSFYSLNESLSAMLGSCSASKENVVRIDHALENDEAGDFWSSRCAKLLSILDTINVDSKASAMVRKLRHEVDNKRINIHTQFARTASYLKTLLSDEGFNVIVLSGTHRVTEIEDVLARLVTGGILITTGAFLTGFELPSAEIVVEYDQPDSQATGFMRRTKYMPREGESISWFRMVRSEESEIDKH